ncbi:hypothetical protein Q4543_14375 [Salipiger sp. 1_MG-2023]|uniref:hypothetical protein n=1 Tax=Salipiger sp. 1_MG-2023 TaxID=3062665 RepID=UPI0026E1A8D1|nr:hypothetical protein [Salipiger sp. 1_MG-2023]MDO6586698.1 hypothetical protein [Salipiger sp. 1_MG-2023]
MARHRVTTARRILSADLPMLAILCFTLGPYLWMALTSLSPQETLFTEGPSLLNATFEIYTRLFRTVGFGDNLLDSFIVAGGTLVVGLSPSGTAA